MNGHYKTTNHEKKIKMTQTNGKVYYELNELILLIDHTSKAVYSDSMQSVKQWHFFHRTRINNSKACGNTVDLE